MSTTVIGALAVIGGLCLVCFCVLAWLLYRTRDTEPPYQRYDAMDLELARLIHEEKNHG